MRDSTSIDKQLMKFRQLSLQPGAAARAMNALRLTPSVELYLSALSWTRSKDYVFKSLFDREYPTAPEEIKAKLVLQPVPVANELLWARAYLSNHLERIQQFIGLAERSEAAYLSGRFDDAITFIDEVESTFGQSFWLFDNRLRLIQATEGLEANKKYAQSLKDHSAKTMYLHFISRYLSMRNEPTVTSTHVRNQFERQIGNHPNRAMVSYLRYRTTLPSQWSRQDIADVLRYEAGGAIIDCYETFVVALQMIVSCDYSDLFAIARTAGAKIYSVTHDRRLASILILLGASIDADTLADCRSVEAWDGYAKLMTGSYNEAFSIAWSGLLQKPNDIDLLLIGAQAATQLMPDATSNLHPTAPIQLALSNFIAILCQSDNHESGYQQLDKMILESPYRPFTNAIGALLYGESSPDPLDNDGVLLYFAATTQPYLHPYRLLAIRSPKAESSYKAIIEKFSLLDGNNFVELCRGLGDEELTHRKIAVLYDALQALHVCDVKRAKDLSEILLNGEDAYTRKKGLQVHMQCLLSEEDVVKVLHVITNKTLENSSLSSIMPFDAVASVLKNKTITAKSLEGSIELPIFYEMFAIYVDNRFEMEEKFAFEDFLFAINVDKPSQIRLPIESATNEQIVFFLRYVCTERIMVVSPTFQQSAQLSEERISVCHLLKEIEPANGELYDTEVENIQKRIAMQKRMNKFEQGKIYVDIEGVKRAVKKSVREQFERLMVLSKLSPRDSEELNSALVDFLRGDIEVLTALKLPVNEFNGLLSQIVKEIRDVFISSTEYGLSGYLSVNIRHHVLEGQLRKPLQSAHLITPRSNTSGTYVENAYWVSRLASYDMDASLIDGCFAQFSAEFDAYVKLILDDWVKIRKTPSESGMFDFVLYDYQLNIMLTYITASVSFDKFCERVIDSFERMLTKHCSDIVHKFQSEAKPEIMRMLTSLQQKVQSYVLMPDTSIFDDAITSTRTAMMQNIDKVSRWFQLQNTLGIEPFFIDEVILQSAEHAYATNPEFKISLSVVGNEYREERHEKEFVPMVLIIGIMLNNVIQHRGAIIAAANVVVEYTQDHVSVTVRNKVSPEKRTKEDQLHVQNLRAAIEHQAHLVSIDREGGTGLHKAWKLISYDFSIEPNLSFGFESDEFMVVFTLPQRVSYSGKVVEEANENPDN